MRRHALAVALIVAASLPVGLPSALGGPVCAAGASPDTIRAAIVVDFGNLGGGSNSVDCITLPKGANGYQLLATRAAQLGVPAPRTDASGNFLCGIDGLPAQSCAIDGGDPNAYWSFWRATPSTSWSYANVGMSTTVNDGEIHGWRFVTSQGSSPDLAPRIRPADAACPAPTPAPTTAPPAPTTAPAPSPQPTSGQAPVAVQPNVELVAPTGPTGATGDGADATLPETSVTSSTTSVADTTSTTTSAPTSTTEVIAGTDDDVEFVRGTDGDATASRDDSNDESGGSTGLLAALGVGLAAVALAFVQSRRTRLTK